LYLTSKGLDIKKHHGVVLGIEAPFEVLDGQDIVCGWFVVEGDPKQVEGQLRLHSVPKLLQIHDLRDVSWREDLPADAGKDSLDAGLVGTDLMGDVFEKGLAQQGIVLDGVARYAGVIGDEAIQVDGHPLLEKNRFLKGLLELFRRSAVCLGFYEEACLVAGKCNRCGSRGRGFQMDDTELTAEVVFPSDLYDASLVEVLSGPVQSHVESDAMVGLKNLTVGHPTGDEELDLGSLDGLQEVLETDVVVLAGPEKG
jgi:hypothetical protein